MNASKYGILIGFFLLNFALRVPGLYQETEYPFCDESFFTDHILDMHRNDHLSVQRFHSGGLNYYFGYLGGAVLKIAGVELDGRLVRIAARFVTAGIISSAAVIFLFLGARRIADSSGAGYIAAGLYTVSPMMLGTARYHYPDHYIIFFSAAVFYVLARILSEGERRDRRWHYRMYLIAGVLAGLCTSVKYSGLLTFLAVGLCGFLIAVPGSALLDFTAWGRRIFAQVPLLAVSGLAFVLTFSACNPEIFSRPDEFAYGLKVEHYVPSDSFWHGRNFYLIILFFVSLGGAASPFYAYGLFKQARRDWRVFLLLSLPLFFLIYSLGRYTILFSRNLMVVMPAGLLFATVGLYAFIEVLRARLKGVPGNLLAAVVLLIVFAEPFARSYYTVSRDLEPDARNGIVPWIDAEKASGRIAPRARILSNHGCTYPAIAGIHDGKTKNTCYDYLVLDSYFGGVVRDGSIKERFHDFRTNVAALDYKDLHYQDQAFIWGVSDDVPEFLTAEHELIHQLNGYGPTVSIFRRKTPCVH